jgi:hypothetical protein
MPSTGLFGFIKPAPDVNSRARCAVRVWAARRGARCPADLGLPFTRDAIPRFDACFTGRIPTSRRVGPAYAKKMAQSAVMVHAGGNLPAEVTSFVGRRRELTDAKRAMSRSRLGRGS